MSGFHGLDRQGFPLADFPVDAPTSPTTHSEPTIGVVTVAVIVPGCIVKRSFLLGENRRGV